MEWQEPGLTSGMAAIRRELEDLKRELASGVQRLEHGLDQLTIEASRPPFWSSSVRTDVMSLRDRLNADEDRLNRLESWRWKVEARLFKKDMDSMRTELLSAVQKSSTEKPGDSG